MSSPSPLLTIASPVYRAEGIVEELVDRIISEVSRVTEDFEIILVEDGSPDDSWDAISKCCKNDSRVKGIRLSRNFGQHFAISAALEAARGDYFVLMDCDLQHNPRDIPRLLEECQNGFDVVYGKQKTREHAWLKNVLSKGFYFLLSLISDHRMDPNIGSYSVLSRDVVDAYLKCNDYRRAYLPTLQWIGFRQTSIPVDHDERYEGKSSYSFGKLLKHALNITVSYSDKLLYITIYSGLITSLLAFIAALAIVIRYFVHDTMEGWSSTMVAIVFFSGLILTAQGITGIYISKIFEQSKDRPRYLVQKKLNFD